MRLGGKLLYSRGSRRGLWTFLTFNDIKNFSLEQYSTMPFKDPEVRRQKAKIYSKRHYESHRSEHIERIRLQKIRNRADWERFKATLQCAQCGENHPATLDFHHVLRDPLNRKISELSQNGAYKQARQEILDKCIVLCANCHRKHHHEERMVQGGILTER